MSISLIPRRTPDSNADFNASGTYLMSIPDGRKGKYRWAQFDDYLHKQRKNFNWQTPCRLQLKARCNNTQHVGTWGFGLWNDPFNTSFGISGSVRRLPVLPNCAWFFYASEPNYLSFHDSLPAQGFLAATFSSPRIPPILLAAGLPFIPLMINKRFARFVRKLLSKIIRQDAAQIQIDVTDWHSYQIDWQINKVSFLVDDHPILTTAISPKGRQGLVLWVDNQFAAFPPNGDLLFGTLQSGETTTLEIKDLLIE